MDTLTSLVPMVLCLTSTQFCFFYYHYYFYCHYYDYFIIIGQRYSQILLLLLALKHLIIQFGAAVAFGDLTEG